jgi:ketosteroid isomerase-like protein
MKQIVLLSVLFITTLSFSGISSAFGLAEALKPQTLKTKKEIKKNKETEEVKKSRAVKALEATLSDWVDAFNNKDIETIMSFYDKDSVYATSDLGLIKGSDNIKAWYKTHFSQIDGTLEYNPVSVTEKGGVGTAIFNFEITSNNRNNVNEASKGRAILVFKKKLLGLGGWFLVSTMAHTTPTN